MKLMRPVLKIDIICQFWGYRNVANVFSFSLSLPLFLLSSGILLSWTNSSTRWVHPDISLTFPFHNCWSLSRSTESRFSKTLDKRLYNLVSLVPLLNRAAWYVERKFSFNLTACRPHKRTIRLKLLELIFIGTADLPHLFSVTQTHCGVMLLWLLWAMFRGGDLELWSAKSKPHTFPCWQVVIWSGRPHQKQRTDRSITAVTLPCGQLRSNPLFTSKLTFYVLPPMKLNVDG